ncbi:hypothetical protein CAEBREN_30750 [Caenorhabditis brenneri]|uniref:Uncharacterized protein n=1 Tax=Caenorhabditis brenneri TaxID=135651 RepID=G0MWP4_CAEBE|nr:hypothetical protein CAEBREN_30750 [Caenorhabditis brenneri]
MSTNNDKSKDSSAESSEEDWKQDSDAPICKEPNTREVHTMNWVKRVGKRTLEQYFECEPFQLGDDEELEEYLSNFQRGRPEVEKEPEPLNGYKFIDETYEQSIPKLIMPEEIRGKYFSLMAGLNISHSIAFPFVMMRYGGYCFLIPFLLSTIVLTFPINFAQYTLAQYTNVPPVILFHRMSPMFFGIGLLVVIVQYISSSAIRFDHRFASMTLELFYSLIAERVEWVGPSQMKGMMNGYVPRCGDDEFLREGQCLPRDYGNYRFGKSKREYIRDRVQAYLQSDEFIREYSVAQAPPDRIFDPVYQHSHYISAATFLSILLFFVCLLWVKTYFHRIQHVVFYGSIFTSTCTLVAIIWSWGHSAAILVSVIGADFWKLLEIKTWVVAAIHSLIIFGTVDASYLGIGSANKFSNRLFIDLIRAKIGGLFFLMLFSTLFGMATMVGASIWMMRTEKRQLTVDDFRILVYSDVQVYEFLYVFFFQNMSHKLLMLVFMMLFCSWEFSSLMLMAEGSIATVYRIFKSTARLPDFLIRYVSLVFHCSFVLFIHFYLNDHRQLPFLLAPYVVFVQIFTFGVFHFKRFFTIIMTFNKRHRALLYQHRKRLRFYYRYVLIGIFSGMILFEIYSNGFRVAKSTLAVVGVLAIAQIVRYKFVYKTRMAWTPTAQFKPYNGRDFNEYRRQERALAGRGIEITDQNEPEPDMKKIRRETEEERRGRLYEKELKDKRRREDRGPFEETASVRYWRERYFQEVRECRGSLSESEEWF